MREQEPPLEVEELLRRLQQAEDALRAIRAVRPDTPAQQDATGTYLAAIADSSDDAIVGVSLDASF